MFDYTYRTATCLTRFYNQGRLVASYPAEAGLSFEDIADELAVVSASQQQVTRVEYINASGDIAIEIDYLQETH